MVHVTVQSFDGLVTLALYVVVVYVPIILAIRHRPDLVEAPRHLFGELGRQQRHLSGTSLQTVRKSVARNAMMVHPENIVLAMLGDDEAEVRSRAVRLIQEARGRRQTGEVRRLKYPEIDVTANTTPNSPTWRATQRGQT